MSTFEQRQFARRQALNNKFVQFNRKFISMQGPETDQLVEWGKIVTPYPRTICTERFPLRSRNEEALAVIVPNIPELQRLGLSRPTFEQAIRFSSQLTPKDGHEGKTLVFPSDPPFSGDVLPRIPCWLTLAWRPAREFSELCLYFVERACWPENTLVVGFAAL
jgi:hypothetical protein